MICEIRIFSGRRNPVWKLTATEQRDVLDIIAEFNKRMSSAVMMPDKLGYGGFVVTGTIKGRHHFSLLHVYRNLVAVTDKNTNWYFHDGTARLERFLIESAGRHLDKSLWQSIRPEVAGGK